jgi:hypothetical protein
MILSREQILAGSDLPKELVPTPEWGGDVYVRTMTAGERDRWESEHFADPKTDVRGRLAAFTLCDEQGNRLFTSADIGALSALSCKPLARIWDVAIRLNRVTRGDVEELEKNSGASHSADSSSDSP